MSCIERSENNGNKAQGYEQVKHKVMTPRLVASSKDKVFLSLLFGFESQRACLSSPWCLICLLGLQGVQWVRGLVVVHVN
jgi:hypothetical protein